MLIAYNLKNPNLSFRYSISHFDKKNNLMEIEVKDSTEKVEIGGEYELFLNRNGSSFKVLGVVESLKGKLATVKVKKIFENKRRFPRFKISVLNLFADVEIDGKTIPGKVIDFSLGGSKLKFTSRNYKKLKEIIEKDENKHCDLHFHILRDLLSKNEVSISAAVVRTDDAERTVSFMFIMDPNNNNVIKLYDYILKKMAFFVN
jgi:hypothetical protein